MRVLAVIPTRNCERQIARVLKKFDEPLLRRLAQVAVLDNRSEDRTVDEAVATLKGLPGASKFEVWVNERNYNLGGSFKHAYARARERGCTHLAFVHGDDQADPRELHAFLDAAKQQPGLDVILGARFMSGARLKGYSRSREWGNRALNAAYSLLSFTRISDIGSGLNLYRVAALSEAEIDGLPDHPAFDARLLLKYLEKGASMRFVPISWIEEDQLSNVNDVQIGWRALETLLSWRVGWRGPSGGARAADLRSVIVYGRRRGASGGFL